MKRKEAKEQGLKVFQGNPCKLGHDGIRYVSTGSCVVCQKEATKQRRVKNVGTMDEV
jgi:hypothetical protein